MANEDEISLTGLVLEPPPTGEISPASGALFENDSIALVTSKLAAMESFLALVVQDYRFTDFMRELLLIFLKVVRSEAGSILEVDHENEQLFFRAIVGSGSDRLDQFTVPMGKGIVGYVAESKQPLVVSNIEENQVYLRAIQDAVGFEARNVVAVPILIRGRVYGVVELLNRLGEETYAKDDLELLTYLADAAAKAIEVRLMVAWAMRQQRDAA